MLSGPTVFAELNDMKIFEDTNDDFGSINFD